VGLQKTRRLVENDKVDLLIGPVSSGTAVAMIDYVKQSKVTWICSGAGLAALTREKLIPNLFRTSCSSWQTNSPIGGWTAEHMGKTAVLIAPDFAGGHDTLAEFKKPFVAKGGNVLSEIYPPLGNKDFLPYLADVQSGKPAFVYAFFSGSDTIAFLQQYAQSGLKASIPLACSGFTTQEQALDAVGDAALGVVSCLHYTAAYDSKVNQDFVRGFQQRFKKRANYAADYGYVVARVIAEALNATGGKTDDRDKWAEAILSVTFEAPRGPFRFDPKTHNVINRAYLTRVEKVNGVLQNVPIQIIENVQDPGVTA
jgi:branched-chain amino acid transport system substrate-binding protein